VKRALLVLFVIALAGCQGDPTDPLDEFRDAHGRLSGLVTIGPNCPVGDCPTPAEAYRQRKVLVYNAARTRLLHTVDLDARGFYLIDLGPADYVVDIRGVGLDHSKDVPKTVTIKANNVTRLDITIDTGLR
jgi:hypothetical protein